MKEKSGAKPSLRIYLIRIFILAILVAVISSSLLMIFLITRNSKERIVQGDHWLISQLCVSAEYLSGQAENLSAALAFDSDIQSAMIEYQFGENPGLNQVRIRINNNLLYKSKLNSALYDCRNVVLFSNEGYVIGSKETFRQDTRLETYEWYDMVEDSRGKSIWLPIGYDNNSRSTSNVLTIPIVRRIFSTQSGNENTMSEVMTVGKPLGYIIVYMNVDMFSNLVAEDAKVSAKRFFLVDENNRIISSKNEREIGRYMDIEKSSRGYWTYQGQEYLMTSQKIENKGWTYICLTNKKEVTREANIVLLVCLTTGILLILIFSGACILISKNIAKPVSVLSFNFKKAENGNVMIEEESGILEFEHLYHSFNETMNKIHTLVNEVYENKLIQKELVMSIKESQIQALRMQINPHFLYNTLDCINWQAQLSGDKQVAEMIQMLGRFFRSNTDMRKEFTTLRRELENIEIYFSLSKLRFGSRLRYFIDCEEELLECEVMKLLLQPLVENSIKYGLECECASENIWIWCGGEEEELTLSVKDDGGGMSGEMLASLRELWSTMGEEYRNTESIGLYNVMRRLYLSYKEGCNFEVFSQPGKGTEIILTFQRKKQDKSEIIF